jgi:hypothetical protein
VLEGEEEGYVFAYDGYAGYSGRMGHCGDDGVWDLAVTDTAIGIRHRKKHTGTTVHKQLEQIR